MAPVHRMLGSCGESTVGVVDDEVQVPAAILRERGGCFDVHARLAEKLADLSDDARAILGLDDDLGGHGPTLVFTLLAAGENRPLAAFPRADAD